MKYIFLLTCFFFSHNNINKYFTNKINYQISTKANFFFFIQEAKKGMSKAKRKNILYKLQSSETNSYSIRHEERNKIIRRIINQKKLISIATLAPNLAK